MPICRAIPPPLGPNGRVGSFAACQAYIKGEERDRPSHSFIQGVVSLETAALEMDAQADVSRCKDPVCHWIVSYSEGEPATNEMIEADIFLMLKAIELEDHQFIAVVHDDTDNRHVHVVANKVGSDGKAAAMSYYKYYSERCMAEIARMRNVPVVPGKHNSDLVAAQRFQQGRGGLAEVAVPDIPSRLNERDRMRLEQRGILPWHEVARPAVLKAAQGAKDWQQFSATLARHGIVLKHTVRISPKDGGAYHGLAFAEGHEAGAPGCKASAIGAAVRYKALVDRWGSYPDRAEATARATMGARNGIPERGAVARTPSEGREAARQRRARAMGSRLAVEAREGPPRLQVVDGHDRASAERIPVPEKEPRAASAKPAGSAPAAIFPRFSISLLSAQQAAEQLLMGLRANAAQAKRLKRRANLLRWSSGSLAAAEPKNNVEAGGRQSRGVMRAQAEAEAAWHRFPDQNINDHELLKRQYRIYRNEWHERAKAAREEFWQVAWSQERATRQTENTKLRRSHDAKRSLVVRSLRPCQLRRVWLKFLGLRYREKRARLRVRQAERWTAIRSQLKERQKEVALSYKTWLLKQAPGDPAAARQYAWIGTMDRRRLSAGGSQQLPPAASECLADAAPANVLETSQAAERSQVSLTEAPSGQPVTGSAKHPGGRESAPITPSRGTAEKGREYEP